MDDVITLVSCTKQRDDYGVERETLTTKEVFAQVHSVTRQEFYEAGRNGLNPSFMFTIFVGDYGGEELCRYEGNQYSIYRTYIVPGTDYIELHVERKGGSNRVATDGTESST